MLRGEAHGADARRRGRQVHCELDFLPFPLDGCLLMMGGFRALVLLHDGYPRRCWLVPHSDGWLALRGASLGCHDLPVRAIFALLLVVRTHLVSQQIAVLWLLCLL